MTKRSVDDLYREGRSYPSGQPHERRHPAAAAGLGRNVEHQAPQMIEDAHDNRGGRYDNDVSADSWLRNGDATTKASFDRGNAWRQPDGSIHGPPGERGQQRSPEPVAPNRRQMKDGG
jgi:hypothetical protein